MILKRKLREEREIKALLLLFILFLSAVPCLLVMLTLYKEGSSLSTLFFFICALVGVIAAHGLK